MLSCNAADRLYRFVPVRAWRAFLIRVHFERCPSCQKALAGAAEARSLFVQETDCRPSEALWRRVARSLAEPDEKTLRRSSRTARRPVWQWAAAGVVVAFLAGYWVFQGFPSGRASGLRPRRPPDSSSNTSASADFPPMLMFINPKARTWSWSGPECRNRRKT